MEPILKAYILEAIAAEKAGLKVDFKESADLKFPEELQRKLDENKTHCQRIDTKHISVFDGYSFKFA